MKFKTLEMALEFFNLMAVEHGVAGVERYLDMKLYPVSVSIDDEKEGLIEYRFKVIYGTNGMFFMVGRKVSLGAVMDSFMGATPSTIFIDAAFIEPNSGLHELPMIVRQLICSAAQENYVPVHLLAAIAEWRTKGMEGGEEEFLNFYESEISTLTKMLQLLNIQ